MVLKGTVPAEGTAVMIAETVGCRAWHSSRWSGTIPQYSTTGFSADGEMAGFTGDLQAMIKENRSKINESVTNIQTLTGDMKTKLAVFDKRVPDRGETAALPETGLFAWYAQTGTGTAGQFFLADDRSDDDADGVNGSLDCDDGNPDVYPGAPQLCDGVNNDCDDESWPGIPADEADSDGDFDFYLENSFIMRVLQHTDIDGDGRADLCIRLDEMGSLARSTGSAFDFEPWTGVTGGTSRQLVGYITAGG